MSGARRGIPECKHQARPDQPELDFTIPELPAATVAYIEARIGEAESLAKWVLAKHQQHVNASIKKSQESW